MYKKNYVNHMLYICIKLKLYTAREILYWTQIMYHILLKNKRTKTSYAQKHCHKNYNLSFVKVLQNDENKLIKVQMINNIKKKNSHQ